jgi:hypothetical protein
VAGYAIDTERSTVTGVRRPQLDNAGAIAGRARGDVEFDAEDAATAPVGQIEITLSDPSARPITIDLAESPWDVLTDERGDPVLYGRATRAVGELGLTGPALLNPVIQLSWRLVLIPH